MAGVLEKEKGHVGACYSGLPHSIGSNHDGWISQSQMGSRRSLKAAPPFALHFDFKKRTFGLVKAARWGAICKHMFKISAKMETMLMKCCTLLDIYGTSLKCELPFLGRISSKAGHFSDLLLLRDVGTGKLA